MPTEREDHHAGDAEQHPVSNPADGNIVGAEGGTPEADLQPQDMPEPIWSIFNALLTFSAPDRSIVSNLSPEERRAIMYQRGRRADQDHSFRKWLLVAVCFCLCFGLLAVIGLVAFMVIQDETAFASQVIYGIGGFVAGLIGGAGSTLAVVFRHR